MLDRLGRAPFVRSKNKTVTTDSGKKTTIAVERINYRESLTPVRAFYLDLAQWSIEDPARWAIWVAPCPIREDEVNLRKAKRRRKARIDARTRERLPVLPVLVNTVNQRRITAQAVLAAAQRSRSGETFTAAGQTLVRSTTPNAHGDRVWADDLVTGKRRDLTHEEDYAFWTFAVVEVLRATGIRVEELLELSHHSLVQYRLPTTGEVVPLLQIAPSKTDSERLLVVNPELAEVLSSIICRSHLAFLARRRALRPTDEYRVPTDEEWVEFLGHFERRKVSSGTCGRAFSTPCIHEHACIRCSMLWPDPAQRDRLVDIRDNLISRIAEAEREGWLGEIEGLRISLAGAEDKLDQIDRRSPDRVDLGMPTLKPAQTRPSGQ